MKRYVLRASTAALRDESERTITVLPTGATLRRLGVEASTGFTQVEWQDQKLLIFTRDLKERAQLMRFRPTQDSDHESNASSEL